MGLKLLNNKTIKEFLRYAVVGGISFIFDTGVLWLFKERILPEIENPIFSPTDARLYIATAAGFIVGITVNFLFSVIFVFISNEQKAANKKKGTFLIYFLVGVIGYVLTALGMKLGIMLLGDGSVQTVVVKSIVTCFVLVWNYLGRKFLVYGGK